MTKKGKFLRGMVGKYKGQGGQSMDDYNKSIRNKSEGYKQPKMPTLAEAAKVGRTANPVLEFPRWATSQAVGAYEGTKNVVNKGKSFVDKKVVNPAANALRKVIGKIRGK